MVLMVSPVTCRELMELKTDENNNSHCASYIALMVF